MNRLTDSLSVLGLVTILACADARATCPGGNEWLPTYGRPGVLDMGPDQLMTSWDPDGAGPQPAVLVIAGSGPPIQFGDHWYNTSVITWDGTQATPLGTGFSFSGSYRLLAITVFNGDLIIGGNFDMADGSPVYNVARWNGTSWVPMANQFDPSTDIVTSLAVYNGVLYAGGAFDFIAGGNTSFIKQWNGTNWVNLSGPANRPNFLVHGMAVYDNKLVAIMRDTSEPIRFWDGSVWTNPTPGQNYEIDQIYVMNGVLYGSIVDPFTTAVSSYSAGTWTPLGSGGPNGRSPLLTSYNGDLIAAGQFTDNIGGTIVNSITRWNGSAWVPMASGLTIGPGVSGGIATISSIAPYQSVEKLS